MNKYRITAKNLNDAADFIENEGRWTQGEIMVAGDMGLDLDYEEVPKCADTKFCALGVLAHVKGLDPTTFDTAEAFTVRSATALHEAFGRPEFTAKDVSFAADLSIDPPHRFYDVCDSIIDFNDKKGRKAKTVANRFRKAAGLL